MRLRPSGRRRARASETTSSAVNSFAITAPRSSTARSPGPEPVEARGEQRLHRRRQARSVSPPSSASARSCSRKNGLPSAASTIRARWSGSRISPPSPVEERVGLLGRERVEHDPLDVVTVVEERGPFLEQLLAGEADDEHRAVSVVGDVLDQVEEGGLGPVDVVEDEDERPVARERFAEPAEEPGDLGGGRRRRPPRARRGPRRAPRPGGACSRISCSGQYVMPSP